MKGFAYIYRTYKAKDRLVNVENVSGPNFEGYFDIYIYQSPVKGKIILNMAKNAHKIAVFLILCD